MLNKKNMIFIKFVKITFGMRFTSYKGHFQTFNLIDQTKSFKLKRV